MTKVKGGATAKGTEVDLDKAARKLAETYRAAEDKDEFYAALQLQYGKEATPTHSTLRKIATAPGAKTKRIKKTRDFLGTFAKDGIIDGLRELVVVYEFLKRTMKLDETWQDAIGRYKGEYRTYRPGKDGHIEGTIKIDKKGPCPWFWHSSTQLVDGKLQQFDHEGFVLFLPDHLYLLGIGDYHLRLTLLQCVLEPANEAMTGVLLTKRLVTRRSPIGLVSKTLMIHRSVSLDDATITRFFSIDPRTILGTLRGW